MAVLRIDPGSVSLAKSSHHKVILSALILCSTSSVEVNCSHTPFRVKRSQQQPLLVTSVWSFIFIASFGLVTFILFVILSLFNLVLYVPAKDFHGNSNFNIAFDI